MTYIRHLPVFGISCLCGFSISMYKFVFLLLICDIPVPWRVEENSSSLTHCSWNGSIEMDKMDPKSLPLKELDYYWGRHWIYSTLDGDNAKETYSRKGGLVFRNTWEGDIFKEKVVWAVSTRDRDKTVCLINPYKSTEWKLCSFIFVPCHKYCCLFFFPSWISIFSSCFSTQLCNFDYPARRTNSLCSWIRYLTSLSLFLLV